MTNVCNHHCPECVVNYFRLSDENSLPRTLAERIIDELGEAGVRALIFTGGGEPLCHPDTPDMVTRARARGMDVGFITNGQLLKPESAGEDPAELYLGSRITRRRNTGSLPEDPRQKRREVSTKSLRTS